jgi:signal transduction histidine kinase
VPPSHRALALAFFLIALVLLTTGTVSGYQLQRVQGEVRIIVQNALTSIRLVGRMEADVQQNHALLDRHIRASGPDGWKPIEAQMAANDADYSEAAEAYAPLVTFAGEAAGWRRFQADVADIRARLPAVLALSRENADAPARARLDDIENAYLRLGHDASVLSGINDRAANESMARIYSVQRSMMFFAVGLAIAGFLLTLGVGLAVASQLARRDQSIRSYMSLLENRNRELDAFAGRVAHDLRGPLMSINMVAGTLARREPSDSTTVLLRRGVGRMEALIKDLLALSRIDSQSRKARCDPAAAAAHVREDLHARLDEAGATMRLDVEPSEVSCSEGLLRQALWNLTDNAIRYGRPGVRAEVDVRGRKADGQYELRVSDNGLGMSPEDARQAFEPFFRGDSARAQPGTGLGLSIVKRVMEASGGSASLSSEPGAGTTFVLRLPRA